MFGSLSFVVATTYWLYLNRLFAHEVIAVARTAAGGQEVFFFSIGISSRNYFPLSMNAQIGQTEKIQGAFIMYENVLFIRGESQEMD